MNMCPTWWLISSRIYKQAVEDRPLVVFFMTSLLTWWHLCHTRFRLLVKKSMAKFLSNDLKWVRNLMSKLVFAKNKTKPPPPKELTISCRVYLWCEKLLNPAGEERFVQYAVDWGSLSRVAFKQLCKERSQFLGVVTRHRRVRPTNYLKNQVLHVASLKLRINKCKGSHSCNHCIEITEDNWTI